MPCDCSGMEAYSRRQVEDELRTVTRLLCEVMTITTDEDTLMYLLNNVDGLKGWWEEHQRKDKIRTDEEARQRRVAALKQSALAKLTPPERLALGLKW